jgi:cytoskeletal protein CcmA (bactofilin family)
MFKKSNNRNMTAEKKITMKLKEDNSMKPAINSVPSGTVEGDLKSNSVTVGEHGMVKGKISADDVIVKGTVKGSITGRNIRIEKSAKITGDLCHQTLSIEAGAHIEGNLSHQERAATPSSTSTENRVNSINNTIKTEVQKKPIL